MINQHTSQSLLVRLPLIYGQIPNDHFNILMEKWGSKDCEYHSAKSIINRLSLKITPEELKKIEADAVHLIDSELVRIFTCRECEVDIRKCGVHRTVTGYQKSLVFLAADGTMTRIGSNSTSFHKTNYGKVDATSFMCGNCGHNFEQTEAIVVFLGGSINPQRVDTYLRKFKKVDTSVFGGVQNHRGMAYIPPWGDIDAVDEGNGPALQPGNAGGPIFG